MITDRVRAEIDLAKGPEWKGTAKLLADEPIWQWYRRPRGKRAHAFNEHEDAPNRTTVAACRRFLSIRGGPVERNAPGLKLCPRCLAAVDDKRERADVRTKGKP